jgi:glutamate synthase domain-containing protein 2
MKLVVSGSTAGTGNAAMKPVIDREGIPWFPFSILAKSVRESGKKDYWNFRTIGGSEVEAK